MNKQKPIVTLSLALVLAACAEQNNRTADSVATAPVEPQVETMERDRPDITEIRTEPAGLDDVDLNADETTSSAAARPQTKVAMESSYDIAYARAPAMAMISAPGLTDRENYLHYQDNGINVAQETPISTFSIDVDSAGYANVRRMLSREGRLPPTDAVRLEEMINYFSYNYPIPESTEQPFSISTELAPAPWSDGHHILQIGLKGYLPAAVERPSSNLVFLVDVSGSMRSPDKLGLIKKSLRLLVNQMNSEDRIALVVYAGAAGTVLESTSGSEKAKILTAIDGLQAGGSTHGSAGIELAYALAQQHKIEGGINRVLIASDGDMNVGTVSIEALKNLIERKRKGGIALTTLGYGSGNYNYALMEQLADVGNGNAAYIDTLQEAQKVLVNEMQSTLLTIASDVKIQVEFNPSAVSEYRLIGYENRMLQREDFENDSVDAGEIGAGHTVTALYEIVLAGKGNERVPEYRYRDNQQDHPNVGHGNELAYVKLRYKRPGESQSIELSQAVTRDQIQHSLANSSDDLRFATSVAGFGQLLQGGAYTGEWDYSAALQLSRNSRGQDPHGYRSELIRLIELADSLSSGG